MASAHYDAVIVGRDLAGLVCATLLAKRKLRVRLYAPADAPTAADPTPLFGLRSAPIVHQVLDEVGLVHATRTRLDGEPRATTLALPDRRLRLEPEAAARGQALGTAFPGRADALVALFDRIEGYGAGLDALLDGKLELPPEGFGSKRAYRKAMAPLPAAQLLDDAPAWTDDPLLRQLLGAMLAAAGRVADDPATVTAGGARALWHLCHGIAPIRDGRAGLEAMLRDKLRTFGGDVVSERPAQRIQVRRRRFESVVCDGAEITAETLVFVDDPQTWAALSGTEGSPAEGRRMRVELPEALRPAGLRDPTGWFSDDAGPVLVRADALGVDLRWGRGDAPDLRRLTPLTDPVPAAPRPVADPAPPTTDPLGIGRRPLHGPLKSMLWAGAEHLYGLGLEGPFASASLAAAAVAKALPRRRR